MSRPDQSWKAASGVRRVTLDFPRRLLAPLPSSSQIHLAAIAAYPVEEPPFAIGQQWHSVVSSPVQQAPLLQLPNEHYERPHHCYTKHLTIARIVVLMTDFPCSKVINRGEAQGEKSGASAMY